MNFRRDTNSDEYLDINLVPLIDVLLVILIFLAATTTFSRLHELEVSLPQASFEAAQPAALTLEIDRNGAMVLNGRQIEDNTTESLAAALQRANADHDEAVLMIQADAQVAHQVVMTVMEAAGRTGLRNIRFATEAVTP